MPISKFKFVSPGVQMAEIDNSQLPDLPSPVGPVIIGRTERGPGLRPVQVNSFSDFVEIFGTPKPGGLGVDVWRNGGTGLSPTYGAYAAQAFLRNSTPVTFVRLLGKEHPDFVAGGEAGWQAGAIASNARTGGAWGLFAVDDPDGVGSTGSLGTGSLVATFYAETGSLLLKGVNPSNASDEISGTCGLVQAGSNGWQMVIKNAAGTVLETVAFNFSETSKNYIRKVFNTNPSLTNATINSDTKTYWLGESFDRSYTEVITGSNPPIGILLPLVTGSLAGTNHPQNDQRRQSTKAETPWVFSQDLNSVSSSFNVQKLFKFRTLDAGAWEQKNFKISIANIKSSSDPMVPYGSFTVELRLTKDSDNSKQIVERYDLCNLNPASSNYLGKKIGDMFVDWDYDDRRYREYGNYPNRSKYFYVVMNDDVENAATNEAYLPFGFEGPVRWKGFTLSSGSACAGVAPELSNGRICVLGGGTPGLDTFVTGSPTLPDVADSLAGACEVGMFGIGTASFEFPKIPLRENSKQGNLASPKDAYFGIDTTMQSSTRFEKSYEDLVLGIGPKGLDSVGDPASIDAQEFSYIFTMEDLTRYTGSLAGTTPLTLAVGMTSSTDVFYYSGSRGFGNSLAITGASPTWNAVLAAGFDAFSVPLIGGNDGLDITEADPFRNSQWGANGQSDPALGPTEVGSYTFNSMKIAIDTCTDPEVVECNMMSVPGLINKGLTDHLIKICEDRADSLGVIDIPFGYTPTAESSADAAARGGNVDNAVTDMEERGLNSSYGCCYYPWIQMRDTENGQTFWSPPSVAAIGTFSSSQRKSEVWFAPAGFTRGGLTEGAAGIPVINVKQKLTSKDRDALYEVNINPIASFPAEGIVVFGQKTLQTTASALDRVNVRRLMIHIKREVSRIAARLLFDQNVQTTWDRFLGQVCPFLNGIMAGLGLTDYKVVLDETTTTPDLIDRNIMYAKIFLKPARAIEFIAIDFVITSTGASFED
jgi:hypothetical protein